MLQLREKEILHKWGELLKLLEKHKENLQNMKIFMNLLNETNMTLTSIHDQKANLLSTDTGGHLLAVEELLHKHALQELQLTSVGDTYKKLIRLGAQAQKYNFKEGDILHSKLDELTAAYTALQVRLFLIR